MIVTVRELRLGDVVRFAHAEGEHEVPHMQFSVVGISDEQVTLFRCWPKVLVLGSVVNVTIDFDYYPVLVESSTSFKLLRRD